MIRSLFKRDWILFVYLRTKNYKTTRLAYDLLILGDILAQDYLTEERPNGYFMLVGQAAANAFHRYLAALERNGASRGLRNCYIMFLIWMHECKPMTYFELLWAARDSYVSDPRDKVYGMLGLATSDHNSDVGLFIHPDYNRSMAEAYIDVAGEILVDRKQVDMLPAIEHGTQISCDWPTWVPNWTVSPDRYLFDPDRKTSSSVRCSFSKLKPSMTSSNIISVQGLVVNSIVAVLDDDLVVDDWRDSSPAACRYLQASTQTLEPEFGDVLLAYTLTAGLDDGSGPFWELVDDHEAFMQAYMTFKSCDFDQHAMAMLGEEPVGNNLSTVRPPTDFFPQAAPWCRTGDYSRHEKVCLV